MRDVWERDLLTSLSVNPAKRFYSCSVFLQPFVPVSMSSTRCNSAYSIFKEFRFHKCIFFFFWLQRKKYDKAIIEWGAHLLTTRLHKNYNVSSHVLPQYVSPAVRTSTTQTYNYCNSFTYSNVCRHEMLKKTYFKLWTGDRKTENSRSLSKRKIKIEIHLV